jgi:hypothetical protein
MLPPMTGSLPPDVQETFARFITTEYTTVDANGQPITWPVTPYYRPGAMTIDITTGVGYPKKAEDARRNPRVALLFSDPTGSGMERPPAVLVQGMATVDDDDLKANRERYRRESVKKLPGTKQMRPPKLIESMFDWYLMRLYVRVRPERVFVWREGDFTREPELFDVHMEEVRSGHSEEPEEAHAPVGGGGAWDERLNELGDRYGTAVLSTLAPDGFPISTRVPISVDEPARKIAIEEEPAGLPLSPAPACLTAHEHEPAFRWQVNFQVRGDLVPGDGRWSLVPHKVVGGFELPPTSTLQRYRLNARKMLRMRRTARRELARRSSRR